MNTDLIHKWLRDPKFAHDLKAVEEQTAPGPAAHVASGHSVIEIDIAGRHQLRIVDGYDPEALARLIRSPST